jgi:hypothetical protein
MGAIFFSSCMTSFWRYKYFYYYCQQGVFKEEEKWLVLLICQLLPRDKIDKAPSIAAWLLLDTGVQ